MAIGVFLLDVQACDLSCLQQLMKTYGKIVSESVYVMKDL